MELDQKGLLVQTADPRLTKPPQKERWRDGLGGWAVHGRLGGADWT